MHTQSHTTSPVRRIVATVIAVIALSSIATLSSARGTGTVPVTDATHLQVTVRFADLDVSSQKGAAALLRRLRSAATDVCSPIQSRGYYTVDRKDACIDAAITHAVDTVDQPTLSTVWAAKRATWPTAR
jgi:UrcA family protein